MPQRLHRFAVEADNGAHPEYTTDKEVVPVIELDTSRIALVLHGVHGLISNLSKNSRTPSTWYFFASLPGCGRCACHSSPRKLNFTREPSRSESSAPRPTSRLSMLPKAIEARVGLAKMARSVLTCLTFTEQMLSAFAITCKRIVQAHLTCTAARAGHRRDNPPGHGVWLFALMESPVGLIVWLAILFLLSLPALKGSKLRRSSGSDRVL